jgi:hypothetical protein
MGVVYLAKNKLMDRLEVLKVISTAMVHKASALDRFLREIRSAAALSHENVVKAHSALQFGDLLVFAMEYVEGDDLAKVVKTQGQLQIANACFYARQVALGLQHAHEKNMVHRDIKPHNLILARDGKKHVVKILDFGLAKATSEKKLATDLTGEGRMLGTPDTMAPEQIQDAATADIRADIYSLGCTLYYFLTGATPFNASSLYGLLQAHQTQEAKSVNLVRPEVPVELGAIVAKMMAKDPAKRYQKPIEVAQALAPYFAKGGIKAPAAPAVSVGEAVKATLAASKRAETIVPLPLATPVPRPTMAGSPFSLPPEAEEPKRTPKKAKAKAPRRVKPLLFAAVAVGVVFLGLLILASGIILRVPTKDGILVVEVDEPNPDVYVDGEKVTVTWAKGGKKAEISIKPGTRKVEVKKDGFTVTGGEVELKEGGSRILSARFERIPPPGQGDKVKGKEEPPKVDVAVGSPPTLNQTNAREVQQAWAAKLKLSVETTNKIGMKLRLIPPGDGVATAFYLGKYEVTQGEWQQVMGYNPSAFGPTNPKVAGLDTSKFPVEQVSWYDSVEFCNKSSEREGLKPYYELTVKKRIDRSVEDAEVKILGGSGYHIPTDKGMGAWLPGGDENEVPLWRQGRGLAGVCVV